MQDEGGLARAVRAEHGDTLTRFDREPDVVEGHVSVGIREREVGDLYRWWVHASIQAQVAIAVADTAGSRQANQRAGNSAPANDGIVPV